MLTVIEPAASFDLTTLDDVKAELGITGTAEDAQLQKRISRASDLIARYCDRVFARERVRETFVIGRCSRPLRLDRKPAQILIVSVDDAPLEDGQWALDDAGGVVRLSGGVPGPWWGTTVAVEYYGGYVLPGAEDVPDAPKMPAALEQACVTLVTALYAGAGRDPMQRSRTVEGVGSTSWVATADMAGLPPQVSGMLEAAGFVRLSVG
ncbi:hypothetical protein HMPREF9946_02157 [Acetobacteraceae bacterium AT-5844]|nr:hypothetical protein HMPREF9946_02157 [Acetobacteraceae bacterium AT-5844]